MLILTSNTVLGHIINRFIGGIITVNLNSNYLLIKTVQKVPKIEKSLGQKNLSLSWGHVLNYFHKGCFTIFEVSIEPSD